MTERLLTEQTTVRFGRERAQHDYRVTIVGNDTDGYRAQVQTRCGRVLDVDSGHQLVQGFVTCPECSGATA